MRLLVCVGIISLTGSLSGLAALAASNAETTSPPMLGKIECVGQTSDDRVVRIDLVVEPGTVSYPAQATAHLQWGNNSPESLLTTLTVGSEQDPDGSGRTLHVFHSALDLRRGFTARTLDFMTGTATLKLESAVQASHLDCLFAQAVPLPRSGNAPAGPESRR
jgi:hypothetical protein